MPKFSIIIPVYNTASYLRRCLDSVFKQSYSDFEVIVINDGSTDESNSIINDYLERIRFVQIDKDDIGPSRARNLGVHLARGDYILFLDSDDYYNLDLLEVLASSMSIDYDIIRFQIQYVKGSDILSTSYSSNSVFGDGVSFFNYTCHNSIVESPCCYAFNRKFFMRNAFKFKENTLHEDFGLIPLVMLKSKHCKYLSYVGYNYVQHENSIMSNNSYDRVKKKAFDFLEHFKYLCACTNSVDGNLEVFNSYIANSVILKATTLKGRDYRKYMMELRHLGVFDMLLCDTMGRKCKKFFVVLNPKLYYKLFGVFCG